MLGLTQDRERMVDRQVALRGVRDSHVLNAMREAPREGDRRIVNFDQDLLLGAQRKEPSRRATVPRVGGRSMPCAATS
jgi:hypothetical protein